MGEVKEVFIYLKGGIHNEFTLVGYLPKKDILPYHRKNYDIVE